MLDYFTIFFINSGRSKLIDDNNQLRNRLFIVPNYFIVTRFRFSERIVSEVKNLVVFTTVLVFYFFTL